MTREELNQEYVRSVTQAANKFADDMTIDSKYYIDEEDLHEIRQSIKQIYLAGVNCARQEIERLLNQYAKDKQQ